MASHSKQSQNLQRISDSAASAVKAVPMSFEMVDSGRGLRNTERSKKSNDDQSFLLGVELYEREGLKGENRTYRNKNEKIYAMSCF